MSVNGLINGSAELKGIRTRLFRCGGIMVDFAQVARMCPRSPRQNIEAHLPAILTALDKRGMSNERLIRLAIATVYTESPLFEPLIESPSITDGTPDGIRFRGRGFLALKGRSQYRLYGERIGMDLENNPDQAASSEGAAEVLAEYLSDRKRKFEQALDRGDLFKARWMLIGGTRGLEEFTECYLCWHAKVA